MRAIHLGSATAFSRAGNACGCRKSLANKTVVIDVEGRTCESCAVHINETLKKLNGIVSAEANYPKKKCQVGFQPETNHSGTNQKSN